jgi:hypothetical protein
LYDSVRKLLGSIVSDHPFGSYWFRALTSSSRIACQLFLRNRPASSTKQAPASPRVFCPFLPLDALCSLKSSWDRSGPSISATNKACRTLPGRHSSYARNSLNSCSDHPQTTSTVISNVGPWLDVSILRIGYRAQVRLSRPGGAAAAASRSSLIHVQRVQV